MIVKSHSKTCFKCGETKLLREFYKHPSMGDGHLGKCKICTKDDVKKNYRINKPHYIEYEKQRYQTPERKHYAVETQKRVRSKNPTAYIAHTATCNAIRGGKLIRQPCEVCGEIRSQAHHDDYSKPLEVRWLCRIHHLEYHGKESYLKYAL